MHTPPSSSCSRPGGSSKLYPLFRPGSVSVAGSNVINIHDNCVPHQEGKEREDDYDNNRLSDVLDCCRQNTTNPAVPDSQLGYTKESLWVDAYVSPYWIQDILQGRGLPFCETVAESEVPFAVVNPMTKMNIHKIRTKLQQKTLGSRSGRQWESLVGDGGRRTVVALIKVCTEKKDLERGIKIHAELSRKDLLKDDAFVGSALIHMYSKCGLLVKAQGVFDMLQVRDVVLWSSLIAGYAQQGHGKEALHCFRQMQLEGISPNAVTLVGILKACGSLREIDKGQEVHREIDRQGLLQTNGIVGNALIDMYAKCGLLTEARDVFDTLPVRNVVSWNTVIAGYAQHELGEEAFKSFRQMRLEGVLPNTVTLACILKACGSMGGTNKGQHIHAEIAEEGLLEKNVFVSTAMVDMYAKRGLLVKAQEVFNRLASPGLISWNALVCGYAQHGHGVEALNCFEQMQLQGFSPDAITFLGVLKACGSIGATRKGQDIHAEMTRIGFSDSDLLIGTALVDMYVKCGLLAKAQEVFDKLPARDVVLWNVMILGYAQDGDPEAALNCIGQMESECITPDSVTFVSILKVCGRLGAIDKGCELHVEIDQKGLVEKDHVLGNALVDMYSKCGLLAKAQQMFDKLLVRDVVAWNSLIAGYAQLGKTDDVFYMFDRMVVECIKPDLVTFIIVLNACNHAGLVNEGHMCFELMCKDYGITPISDHHTCMIDLLGRAGQLERAVAIVKLMPFHGDTVLWHIMLGVSRKWGDVQLGRQAFENALQLNEEDREAYVCISNIISGSSMQD